MSINFDHMKGMFKLTHSLLTQNRTFNIGRHIFVMPRFPVQTNLYVGLRLNLQPDITCVGLELYLNKYALAASRPIGISITHSCRLVQALNFLFWRQKCIGTPVNFALPSGSRRLGGSLQFSLTCMLRCGLFLSTVIE